MKHTNLINLLRSLTGETVKRAELIAEAKKQGVPTNETLPAFRVPGAAVSRGVYSVPKMLDAMESGFAAGRRGRKPKTGLAGFRPDDSGDHEVLAPTQSDIRAELNLMGADYQTANDTAWRQDYD